jgi:RHS repeat-associated protein
MHFQPQDAQQQIMFARYYGGSLGRFLSTDPIVKRRRNSPFPQRWNRYTYVRNNPLTRLDLSGLDDYTFHIVWGNGTQPSAEALTKVMKSTAEVLHQGGHTVTFDVRNPEVQWERPDSPGTVTDVDVMRTSEALGSPMQTPDNHTGIIVIGETVVDQTKKGDEIVDGTADDEHAAAAVATDAPNSTGGHETVHLFGVDDSSDKHGEPCSDDIMCSGETTTDLTDEQRTEVENGMGRVQEDQ